MAIHALDVFWRVRPSADPGGLLFHWPDAVALLALGGFWVGAYLFQLRRRPLLPLPQVQHA